jgi:hypothetical protein
VTSERVPLMLVRRRPEVAWWPQLRLVQPSVQRLPPQLERVLAGRAAMRPVSRRRVRPMVRPMVRPRRVRRT